MLMPEMRKIAGSGSLKLKSGIKKVILTPNLFRHCSSTLNSGITYIFALTFAEAILKEKFNKLKSTLMELKKKYNTLA